MTDVTRILNASERGEAKATEELLPLVYEELRLLAAQKLSHEPPGQTLQATALVHEAYIRLVLCLNSCEGCHAERSEASGPSEREKSASHQKGRTTAVPARRDSLRSG